MTIYPYNLITDKRRVDKTASYSYLSPLDLAGDGNSYIIGTMRDKMDYIDPVFVLQIPAQNIRSCNYIYCSDLDRYYFVQNKVAINDGLYEFHCHEDVLTTYASQILASTALVSRRQTNARPFLADPMRPLSNRPQYSVVFDDAAGHDYFDPTNNNSNTKYSFVGIMATPPGIGASASYVQPADGSLVYPGTAYTPYNMQSIAYAFTYDDAVNFFQKFYVEDFSSFMNALWGITSDGVIDFISYPFDLTTVSPSVISATAQTVNIMGKTLTMTAPHLVINPVATFAFSNFSRACPSYLDYEPYTRATLYLPYVGMTDIPMQFLRGGISVYYLVDLMSGDAQVVIGNGNGAYVKTMTAHIGVHIPVTKTNNVEQARNALLTSTSDAMQAMTAKTPAGGLSILGDALVKIGLNTSTMTGSVPANELARFLRYRPYMLVETVEDLSATDYGQYVGYPFNETVTLSSLSGEFAKIDRIYKENMFTSVLFDEWAEIERLLKDGVFL